MISSVRSLMGAPVFIVNTLKIIYKPTTQLLNMYRGRIIAKRINVRIEHVRKSRCQEDLIQRIAENKAKIAEAKAAGKKISLKRWVSVVLATLLYDESPV